MIKLRHDYWSENPSFIYIPFSEISHASIVSISEGFVTEITTKSYDTYDSPETFKTEKQAENYIMELGK